MWEGTCRLARRVAVRVAGEPEVWEHVGCGGGCGQPGHHPVRCPARSATLFSRSSAVLNRSKNRCSHESIDVCICGVLSDVS